MRKHFDSIGSSSSQMCYMSPLMSDFFHSSWYWSIVYRPSFVQFIFKYFLFLNVSVNGLLSKICFPFVHSSIQKYNSFLFIEILPNLQILVAFDRFSMYTIMLSTNKDSSVLLCPLFAFDFLFLALLNWLAPYGLLKCWLEIVRADFRRKVLNLPLLDPGFP